MTILSADRVRELLSFDSATGVFTWRVDRPGRSAGSPAGSMDGRGYLRISIDDKDYRAHRLARLWAYGVWPSEVDHINRDKRDNRLANLREVTHAQNQQNRAVFRNNTSGHPGVDWHKASGRWRARLGVQGKRIDLWLFDSIEAAVAARATSLEKGGSA